MILFLMLLSMSMYAADKTEKPMKPERPVPAMKPPTDTKQKHREAKEGKHLHVVMQGNYTIQPRALFR